MTATENKSKNGHTYLQWLTAILANTTLVTYGLQTGWVSPMTKILQSESSPIGTPLTDSDISWIASIICMAATVSVIWFAYIADKYGRRVGILIIAVCQALCWILKLFTRNITALIVARVLCGLAAGGCFNVVPIYVKEISQDNIKGLLGSLLILFQNLGMLFIFALGAYFDYYTVLWIVVWLPIVTVIVFLKAPESPAFLVKRGKTDEAAAVIAFLRGLEVKDKSVQNEISAMSNEDLYFKSLPEVSFVSILKNKAWRRGFLLILLIMTVHAWCGSFSIIIHATTILSASGVTISPELQSLSFPAIMILASFVSMSSVERFGRKPLLTIAFLVVAVSMVSLGTIVLVQNQGGSVPGWLSVLSMIGTVAGYAVGVSPVPYIIMSEMFNFQIRAKCMGYIVSYTWFLTFLQLFAFPVVSHAFGLHTAFYCFGVINILGVVATLVLLPETIGKTVEEIEAALRGK